ncbi:MAG: SCO family protein [Gammaproteobacteria bacterium]|nr:SCO family protein [Rhodocyclaceae bacterium]MBU3910025.1 SCO family protein [Gammaproteobacteria bacterium]MBU3989893.1 SCO family protein [Gammaproteobacteria bacterium]MBU4003998.1 SCO family protein [Gammaproteobacteria bacterium]MBU4020245.1 SCO family protein [Gammaproteobacteria bacterium]
MRGLLVAINVLLIFVILGLVLYWHPEQGGVPASGNQPPHTVLNVPLAAPPVGGDFTLDGPAGPFALAELRGKLVVLQFGYTYCPDICPTGLSIIAQMLASLTPVELARVQVLFVSVDPERDNVARLVEYTTFFHPSIIGLTGQSARLAEIAGRYGAAFVRQDNVSAGGYVIDHTALTYLIDRDGRLVASLPHALPAEQLAAEIRKHLPNN